jgi:hypothetical protein
VESNFTLSGARRKREYNEALSKEIGNGEGTKRLKIEDTPTNTTTVAEREVNVNRKMK